MWIWWALGISALYAVWPDIRKGAGRACLWAIDAAPDGALVIVPIIVTNLLKALSGLALILGFGWLVTGSLKPIHSAVEAMSSLTHH
jgi:hypothetical protein